MLGNFLLSIFFVFFLCFTPRITRTVKWQQYQQQQQQNNNKCRSGEKQVRKIQLKADQIVDETTTKRREQKIKLKK